MNPLLAGLVLQDPGLLVLLVLIPWALLLRLRRGEPTLLDAAVSDPAAAALRGAAPAWWSRLPLLAQALGVALLIVALARPVIRVHVPEAASGIDILLALDLSSSMEAQDLDPARSRLDIAKAAADAFVAGRPRDRIGLMGFARYPDVRVPLTHDHRALRESLAAVELVAREGPEDLTGIGAATARAAQILHGAVSPSRVLVLLTDGEENVATRATPEEIAPAEAAALARELGVRVHVIAAGAPVTQDGTATPAASALAHLAEQTGGTFHRAEEAGALSRIYARIDELETAPAPEPHVRLLDRFAPFLGAGAVLVLLGLLAARRPGAPGP
jgi:Ca-activated chloride channel family protein